MSHQDGPGAEAGEHFQLEDRVAVIQSSSFPPAAGTKERRLAEKMLLRKLDFRLLPARTGITAARLKGFEEDLGLTGKCYVTDFEQDTELLRPSVYIGACVIAWGLASALTGVHTPHGSKLILSPKIIDSHQLRENRNLSNFPSIARATYLLSCWYTKEELTLRATIMYAGLVLSNGFGSLLAAGIFSGMEGVRGIRGWRWLFLIEGSFTIAVGFLMMFVEPYLTLDDHSKFPRWILPDYPHNTRWMTSTERRLVQTRIAEDAGEADRDTEEDSSLRGLKMAVQDPIVVLFALYGICQLLGSSYSIFFPTLARNLGFNVTDSLLLAAVPWVLVTILCCVNAWHAGKTGERFFHMAVWLCGPIIGLIVSLCTMSVPARYFSMFLMASSNAAGALLLPWVANVVLRPPAKRAAAIAVVNAVTNLGSMFVHAIMIRQLLVRRNRELDVNDNMALAAVNSMRVKDAAVLEGITYEEATERRKRVRFLY
ncbi:MFS general substrate transporter [Mycena capillaripes]|nr:MFS general substrate transporter [Mycena capillaripes]